MLRSFDNTWLSLADKVTMGRYNFVSLLAFVLSLPAADKIQWFIHLSFNSTLKLINTISSDHK